MTIKHQESIGNPIRLLLHVPVPWVFVLTYLVGVGLEFAFPLAVPKERLLGATVAGAVLFVVGAALAGWSLLIFNKARTTTVPGKASSKLVTRGPYLISRNPMYVGLVLAYLGEAGILKQVWPVALLPLTVAYINSIVIPVEETRLKEVFQEDYERYRNRVRRWI
jgi:protein-S-isoprenylcysteine O-methyltransferase Ste14